MKVYDEYKTKELNSYDLEKGYLKSEKLFIAYHPSIVGKEEKGHYKIVKEYANGGKDVEWVVDVPAVQPQNAWEEYEDIQVYVPYSEEELKNKRIAEIKKRLSQLSEDFIQNFVGAQFIDLETRKEEFSRLHNELRNILGKEPRYYL